jgi:hypothetical protein
MIKSRMMKCDCPNPVRTRKVWTKRISRLALGGALGLIVLTGIAPGVARAEDSGEAGLFGSVLKSLGLGGENHIEYRERPPLVVPPTRDLPPPQTAATARDPNWPVDPKSAQPPKKGSQVRDLDRIAVPQRPLEPGVGGSAPAGGPDTTAAIPPGQPAASSGFFGNLFSSSDRPSGPIMGAPSRKSLTEPPPDYESPSPSQPYGGAPPPAASARPATPEGALQTAPGASGL